MKAAATASVDVHHVQSVIAMEEDVPAVRRRERVVFVEGLVGELGQPGPVHVHRVQVAVAVAVAREDHGAVRIGSRALERGRRGADTRAGDGSRQYDHAQKEEDSLHGVESRLTGCGVPWTERGASMESHPVRRGRLRASSRPQPKRTQRDEPDSARPAVVHLVPGHVEAGRLEARVEPRRSSG